MHSNTPFALVAEQLSAPLVLADREGRLTWANRAFLDLCGYELSEMIGHHPGSMLQGTETEPSAVRELRAAVRNVRSAQVEIINYRKCGEPYLVAIDLDPVFGLDGSHIGFVAVEKELTAAQIHRRRLEAEVAELYGILCHVNGSAA